MVKKCPWENHNKFFGITWCGIYRSPSSSIKKLMQTKRRFNHIEQQPDTWHITKELLKGIMKAVSKKGNLVLKILLINAKFCLTRQKFYNNISTSGQRLWLYTHIMCKIVKRTHKNKASKRSHQKFQCFLDFRLLEQPPWPEMILYSAK